MSGAFHSLTGSMGASLGLSEATGPCSLNADKRVAFSFKGRYQWPCQGNFNPILNFIFWGEQR